MSEIKADFYRVLDASKNEVGFLAASLKEGRVDGHFYEGECACLIGTVAKAKGCSYGRLTGGLRPDASRPAERWFLAIRAGDTPEINPISKITLDWIYEWRDRERSHASISRCSS